MKLPEFQYLLPGRYRASDALEYRHPVLGWIEVAQDGFYREIREVVGDLPPGVSRGFYSLNQARRKVAKGEWCLKCRRLTEPHTCGHCGEPKHEPTDHEFTPLYCLCHVQIVGQTRSVRSNSGPAFAGDPTLDRVLTEILDRCETVNQVRVELYDHGLLREYPKVKAN